MVRVIRKNPPPKRRRNSEQTAAELSEAFHGRPARQVRDYVDVVRERTELADLGKLIELKVRSRGRSFSLPFDDNRVRVASAPGGGQLYFVGGDQALDLDSVGLGDEALKDHLVIGELTELTYFTSKAFHNFEPTRYFHKLGEEGGERPLLAYDTLNRALYLVGGSYTVRPEGIVN